jgi:hypothetical protein
LSDKRFPLIRVPGTVFAVDLELKPGEERTCELPFTSFFSLIQMMLIELDDVALVWVQW